VTTEHSLSAEFSGIFLALEDRTALVLVELVIWLYGYLVILLYGYFLLVKVVLVLIFVWKSVLVLVSNLRVLVWALWMLVVLV
jgi:hypothetical protein